MAVLAVVALAGCGSSHRRASTPRGATAEHPTGLLYLADASPGHLTVLDASSGRGRTWKLAELAPGDPPYLIALTGGRLVVYGGDRTYALDPDGSRPARSLGTSWFFVPAAAPGLVWLALLDYTSPDTVRGLRGVREVTVHGRVVLARSARPPRWPLAALDTGLLLQAHTLELWDPATGRILRRVPGLFPVATRRSLVASCGRGCPVLHLTDTRTGKSTDLGPGPGFRFQESYDGAFSPDGSSLAVSAVSGGQSRVALVDLRRHSAKLIGGAPLGQSQSMAWSSTGWLFFYAGAGRLAAYRPGAAGASLLPGRVRPTIRLVAG